MWPQGNRFPMGNPSFNFGGNPFQMQAAFNQMRFGGQALIQQQFGRFPQRPPMRFRPQFHQQPRGNAPPLPPGPPPQNASNTQENQNNASINIQQPPPPPPPAPAEPSAQPPVQQQPPMPPGPSNNDFQPRQRMPMNNFGGPRPPFQNNRFNTPGGMQRQPRPPFGQQTNQGASNNRPGDWDCSNCKKLNFSFRNECKFCKTPKGQQPAQNMMSSEPRPPPPQQDPKFSQSLPKLNDWQCIYCGVNNFSRRTSCFKCHQPKEQDEQEPQQQPPTLPPPPPKEPEPTNPWTCSSCNQCNGPQAKFCIKCSCRRPQMEQQPSTSTGASNTTTSTSNNASSSNNSEVKKQQEQFEQMFSNWERQFDEWKKANANNPDQDYVRNYVNSMNSMKESLLERRRNLQAKVDEQQQQLSKGPSYYTASPSKLAQPQPPTSDSISDIVKAAVETSKRLGNKPSRFEPAPGPSNVTSSSDASFLPRGKGDGIPGLGDGQDPEGIEKEQNKEDELSKEDQERISRLVEDDDEDDYIPQKKPRPSDEYNNQHQPSWKQYGEPPNQPRFQRPSFEPRHQQPQFARNPWNWKKLTFNPQDAQQPRPQRPQWNAPHQGPQGPQGPQPPRPRWNGPPSQRAWNERNELFINPDDDCAEEDLFERRDSGSGGSSWNPSAKVVDYGHGSASSNPSNYQQQRPYENRNDQRDYGYQDRFRGQEEDRFRSHGGFENRRFEPRRGYEEDRRSYERENRGYQEDYRRPSHPPSNYRQDDNNRGGGGYQSKEFSERGPPAFPSGAGPSRQSQPPKGPQGEVIQVDDLIHPPGRYMRPPKIVVIFRGIPGSGKSFVAKNIKSQESSYGSEAPRILALDDYFECDGEYEYEPELEESYRASLIKSFKKQIDDGYFSFIMVDCINSLNKHYEEMWSYAKQKGFEVYIAELECDVNVAVTRNVHGWKEDGLKKMSKQWDRTPDHYNKLDLRGFLQDKEITQVEMEDAEPDEQPKTEAKKTDSGGEEEDEDQDTSSSPFKMSKWELMDKENKMAQLDGVSEKAIKRLAEHHSINDWLELSDASSSNERDKNGKKRVRWADLEERKTQMKMREIGFVVGQTNWNRMMDPTEGSSALTRTKIIPNRYQSNNS